MNLIVTVAIVLLNLHVAAGTNYRIPQFVRSTHSPDVTTSICAETDLGVPHE